jgi:hypothetical protein
MKITDIILESDRFQTIQTGEDPETGKISWNVVPTPSVSLNNNLDQVYADFLKFAAQNPNDVLLEKYLQNFKNLKQALRSHMTKKYSKRK